MVGHLLLQRCNFTYLQKKTIISVNNPMFPRKQWCSTQNVTLEETQRFNDINWNKKQTMKQSRNNKSDNTDDLKNRNLDTLGVINFN